MCRSGCFLKIHDVVRASNANEMGLERHEIEVALRLLCESGGIVRKVGDSSGGLFVVGKPQSIFRSLARHHCKILHLPVINA